MGVTIPSRSVRIDIPVETTSNQPQPRSVRIGIPRSTKATNTVPTARGNYLTPIFLPIYHSAGVKTRTRTPSTEWGRGQGEGAGQRTGKIQFETEPPPPNGGGGSGRGRLPEAHHRNPPSPSFKRLIPKPLHFPDLRKILPRDLPQHPIPLSMQNPHLRNIQ